MYFAFLFLQSLILGILGREISIAQSTTEMSFRTLFFAYRKPGITPAEFKEHRENQHIPLIKSIAGAHFPLVHTRHYIHRAEGTGGGLANLDHPATILAGFQEDIDFDGVGELTFESEGAFKAFISVITQPDAAAKIAADEKKFLDGGRMLLVIPEETTVRLSRY